MMGRFFDHHVLDMVEFGIDKHTPMSAFHVRTCSVACHLPLPPPRTHTHAHTAAARPRPQHA